MARASKDTIAYASLRGDVDALRIRLEQIRRDAQRVVQDLDHLLSQPPYAVNAKAVDRLQGE